MNPHAAVRRLTNWSAAQAGQPLRTAPTDVAAVLITGTVALSTLDSVFDGRRYLVAGMASLLVGVLVGWLANRRGWMSATALAVTGVALFALSASLVFPETALARWLPSGATLIGFADGAITSWRGLLTTTPPVPAEGSLLMAPYLAAGLAGLAGVLLAARSRMLAAPLIGPAVLLVIGLLLGTDVPVSPLATGGVFAIVALLTTISRHSREVRLSHGGPGNLKRFTQATGIVAVATLAATAVVLAPAASGTGARFVLREHVELPFDPSVYPSPLSGFRKYEVIQKRDVLFSVTGVPAGARIRLAAMDAYDGLVWKVAGSGGRHAASGVFERVGAQIPAETSGRHATVVVTIRELGSVWIPTVGSVTSLRFPGRRGPELTDNFRYNRVTGSGVLRQPSQLRAGDTISFDAVVSPPVTPQAASGRRVDDVSLPFLSGVPDQVETVAADWTAGASGPLAVLDAIVKRMRNGAFSDGTTLSGSPSWSGHSAGRIREFLGAGQLVGDAEQYAACLALMARELGLPARVVLGVTPPSPEWTGGEVTGEMVSAWVEVRFAGMGWVPFDPTPPVTNTPRPPKPPSDVEGTTEVVHPPVIPEAPPAQRPPLNPNEDVPSATKPGCAWCQTVLVLLLIILPPVLLVVGVCGLLLYLKWRRRHRRRTRGTPRQRIAAGWLELLDGLRDHRVPVPEGLTRQEVVKGLYRLPTERLGQPHKVAVRGLAHRADEAVFGPDQILTSHLGFWSDVDGALRAIADDQTVWRRIGAALNPVTLLPATVRR